MNNLLSLAPICHLAYIINLYDYPILDEETKAQRN